MELLVREGLDVQPQQGLAVDLARRARTLPRCIIRSREPNDLAIAVADSATPLEALMARLQLECALSARGPPRPIQFCRSIGARGSKFRRFLRRIARGGSGMGSPCAHEGGKRPIPEMLQRECGRERRSVPSHQ
jgi:hypothetical protein